jgi:hypothetical protein
MLTIHTHARIYRYAEIFALEMNTSGDSDDIVVRLNGTAKGGSIEYNLPTWI